MGRRRKTGLCACGSKTPYLRCCARYISGDELPATPAQLMQSRYTAYALGNASYIIATTDPDGPMWETDHDAWRASIADFSRGCDFLGVHVLDESADGDDGTVHFHALLSRRREDVSFQEHSIFARRGGRWLYWGRK